MKQILISIICSIFLVGITACTKNRIDNNSYVEIEGKKFNVEIAETSKEKQQGLMFREELCNDCGMLFIFSNENIRGSWMKNTLIPLDMLFINANLEIVDIKHADPCVTEKCESYTGRDKAMYVLEVNKNMFDEKVIGQKIKINK